MRASKSRKSIEKVGRKMKAFFCLSPVHVFRTVSLMLGDWKKETADIFIFNPFSNSRELAERLKEQKLFENVYWMDMSEYSAQSSLDVVRKLLRKGELRSTLKKKVYDEIYFFNSTWVLNTLAYTLCYRNNKNIELNYMEDGPALNDFYEWNWNRKMKLVFPLLGMRNPARYVKYYWFTDPELIRYRGRAKTRKFPPISRENRELIACVNYIFQYKPYDFSGIKLMLMEECFYNDKSLSDNSDFELFNKIKNRYAEEGILVKLHPRTRHNRFVKEYHVFEQQGIPWEVIALNTDTSRLIMVSLSCTTMMSAKLLYGDEPQIIYLYPMFLDKVIMPHGEPYYDKHMKYYLQRNSKLYTNSSKVRTMRSEKELFTVLDKILGKEGNRVKQN